MELPPNLTLSLRLTQEINVDDAAIGDAVRAELTNDLKIKGQVLVRKGAMAQGRITRLDRYSNATVLGLTFSDLDSDSMHASLVLSFDGMVGAFQAASSSRGVRVGPPRPHEGLTVLGTGHVRLIRGILLMWRT